MPAKRGFQKVGLKAYTRATSKANGTKAIEPAYEAESGQSVELNKAKRHQKSKN